MNKKHFISLLSYLGVGFIGGSISHGFFTGTRSAIMAAIGLFLFVLGELLNKDPERSRGQTIIYGLLYSLSIGMISGGFTHFLDSPERSLWILPAGYLVSRLVFAAKNKWEGFNRLSIIGGIVTTALLFGAGRSAIRYLPSSFYSQLADHHNENTTGTVTGTRSDVNHDKHDMDTGRLTSGVSTQTTYELMFDGMGPLIANQESTIQFYPHALVGGDAIQTIDDLIIEHEKYIHLILVRKDGGDFLHLHPEKDSSGKRVVKTMFPSGGERYIYADLNSKQFGKLVLIDNLTVEGPNTAFITSPIAGTGTTIVQSGINFNIIWDKASTINATNFYLQINSGTLENYLGAKGHMVAINLSDMGYSHVHPMEGGGDNQKTSFMAHFTNSGVYRIFIQVQINGIIYTLPLSIEVENKGTESTVDHSH